MAGSMMKRCAVVLKLPLKRNIYYSQRYAARKVNESRETVDAIRNIGLLAHIDAGKTTTTERMLFYAGRISNMGEVHHGNTVTDYMEQERQRGITISSVAVTFPWNNCRFNLVDTPGHIDFTMEVEQSLGVLDGAVILLDGSAGVEAQTITVWRQAERYKLPCVIYANKMDRSDADIYLCHKSIENKLGIMPLPIQLPLMDSGKFKGIVDVIALEKIIWDPQSEGRKYTRCKITHNENCWEECCKIRNKLIENLADKDDEMAESVIKLDSLFDIQPTEIVASLRRLTLAKQGVPVVCGSSYKNIGVQTLMDAIIEYLPSPSDRNQYMVDAFKGDLCARAFKVIHDDHKGPITFFRIFSGKLSKGQKIYNIQKEKLEQIGKLMVAFADEYQEVTEVTCGNIAAVTGLKLTVAGNLISSSASAVTAAKKRLSKLGDESSNLLGVATKVPVPVFFCSIEPPSKSAQVALEQALQELQREDPSLYVEQEGETGQTILGGMGELHLEIIKNRIISEYNIDVELGSLQIAYKETISSRAKHTHVTEHKIGTSLHHVTVTLSVLPQDHTGFELLILDRSPDNAANIAAISPRHMKAVKQGVQTAMTHGPKLGCPVANVQVILHWLEVKQGTSDTIISAAVTQCIRKILKDAGPLLMEPVMSLEVVTNEECVSMVLADLSRRRTDIQEVTSRGMAKVVCARTPLSELLGYSTDLRVITSGTASFSMEFISYQIMSPVEEAKAIRNVTGFQATSFS